MNRDELVEKVAKALCDTEWGDGIWDKPGLLSQMEQDAYNGLATAAIDTVLEEAARQCRPQATEKWTESQLAIGQTICDRILALGNTNG